MTLNPARLIGQSALVRRALVRKNLFSSFALCLSGGGG